VVVHLSPGLISSFFEEKKVSEQEFRRSHHNHLTSINDEIDRRDNGDVRIARRISDETRAKISCGLVTPYQY
jgi:hypothetical protein